MAKPPRVFLEPLNFAIEKNCASLSETIAERNTPDERLAIVFAVVAACSGHFNATKWKDILTFAVADIEHTLQDDGFNRLFRDVQQY